MTSPIRKVLAAAGLAIVCVLILQAVFVASLTMMRAHTDLAAIRAHITQAFADGVLGNDERPRLLIHRYGHQFTECTGLHLSIDDQPDPLKAALLPQLHSRYVGPCGELERSAAGIATPDRTDYSRYWHGYRLYIWPMLEHFSLQNVRFINAVLLFAAVAFFFTGLRQVTGGTPAAVFFIVLMALSDIWRMWNITTHTLSTIVILGGAGLFARAYLRSRDLTRAIVLASAFGAVFNFVDFLINPPMMPMLLAFIVIAAALRDIPRLTRPAVLDASMTAGLVALAWFGGYALTWASEWALAGYFSADSAKTWAAIVKQIALRLYGTEPDSVVPIYPLVPTLTMIVQSFISVGSLFVAVLAAALFVHARQHWAAFDWKRFLLFSSPTVIATGWFELLNNHTQTHSHFTYRSESAAIAIVFAAFIMATAAPVSVRSLLTNLWTAAKPARKPDPKA
jgi:hypothetical protein